MFCVVVINYCLRKNHKKSICVQYKHNLFQIFLIHLWSNSWRQSPWEWRADEYMIGRKKETGKELVHLTVQLESLQSIEQIGK